MTGVPPVDASGAAALLRTASDVLVVGHVQPDPDAFGSSVALAAGVRRRGIPVAVAFAEPDPVPQRLRSLDPDGLVVALADAPARPDVLVTCDCPAPRRLGALADRLDTARVALVVDHHASFTPFGTHHLVDATAPATVVLVRDVLAALGEPLDRAQAAALFAGLYTDTGGFRSGGADTLRLAAELVEAGADPGAVLGGLSTRRSFDGLAAMADVLAGARREPAAAGGAGLVWASAGAAIVSRFRSEVSSVLGHLRSTIGPGVAAVLSETAPGMWSVSLRGDGTLDLSAVAGRLGGGGHRGAAGFERSGTRDEVLDAVRDALGAQAEIGGGGPNRV